MKILMLGNGKGSWQMRGHQLGAAMGARVTAHPTDDDFAWADVIVLVKHAAEKFGSQARQTQARVVWDVVDWWKQPEDNRRPVAELVREIHAVRDRFQIDLLIGTTRAEATDLGGVYLPHHSRVGVTPAPARDRVSVVAYEGRPKYLGAWKRALERVCQSRGWTFVINPPDLRDADVVVSFRDGQWDGELCQRWKSGVKIANAIAAGRAIVTQPCAAADDADGAAVYRVQHPDELEAAIQSIRLGMVAETQRSIAPSYRVDTIAGQYRDVLKSVARKAA